MITCALLLIMLQPAATLEVPAQYGTIQCALDSMQDGDSVVVAPGIYFENLRTPRDIRFELRSSNPNDSAIVLRTIVDGGSRGSVIYMLQASVGAKVSGITVQHGRFDEGAGGGFSGYNSITIENSIVRNNVAGPLELDELPGQGGGIAGTNGLIENNVIMDNEALGILNCDEFGCDYIGGRAGGISGGVACDLKRNILVRNKADRAGSAMLGCGGTIENNLIRNHGFAPIAQSDGNFLNNEIAFNGDLTMHRCTGTIARNFLHSNRGIVIHNVTERGGNVVGNFLFENRFGVSGVDIASENVIVGIEDFAAIFITKVVANNLILQVAPIAPAFIDIEEGIWSNVVFECGTGVQDSASSDIAGNIFWNISNGATPVAPPDHTLRYNIIQGTNHWDETNIVADPLFVDPENMDFRLQPGSPAIDAGVALASVTEDIVGTARPVDGTAEPRGDGSDYDIGAVEYVPGVEGEGEGIASSLGDSLLAMTGKEEIASSLGDSLLAMTGKGDSRIAMTGRGEIASSLGDSLLAMTWKGDSRIAMAGRGDSRIAMTGQGHDEPWYDEELGLAGSVMKGAVSDAFWEALRNGQPPPGVGIIDPPTWPEWVWNPEVPVPEDVVFPDVPHAADWDNNKRISISELLRVIQIYNSEGYLCSLGTEDDFAPGANIDTCCKRHSADYAPFDYKLDLNELLRMIQFYNAGVDMDFCGDTEDGYCFG